MRTRLFVLVAALLLVSAGAKAQQPTAPDTAKAAMAASDTDNGTNEVDFGFRVTAFGNNSDEARYQRYRDLRNGATLDRFRFTKENDSWSFIGQADHVGYLDQRYSASINNFGNFKVSFEWNQIPLFYSSDTQTLYTQVSPGVLRLDDSVQSGIQGGTLTLAKAAGFATAFDLRSQRNIADVKAVYSVTDHVDLNVYARNTTRSGQQQYSADFGFSDAIDLPITLDTRTTDLGSALEWSNGKAVAKLGYDGSFFRNAIPTLIWDNPLRIIDSPTAGPLQGRMSLWPDSNYNSANASGSISMPGRSQATAYVAVGNMTQDNPLIPFTINTALASPALDRPTSDVSAKITSTAFSFSSRPVDVLWLTARYRSYDFNNQTPVFNVGNTVSYDTTVAALNAATDPIGYKRQTFDAEASVTPLRYTAFRLGYTRENWDYTARQYTGSKTDTVRASLDTTGLNWLTLRGVYEHAKRVGTGLDLTEFLAIGEQPTLRQYDIASRDTDRFSGIIQISPVSAFSVNALAAIGTENYPETSVTNGFGLFKDDSHSYSVGFDYVPTKTVSMGANYEYDKYTALQWSRTANPPSATDQTFYDARRNWNDNSADGTNTVTASIELLKLITKTDIRVGYDYNKATSSYVYGLVPNTTLPAPIQLSQVLNKLQRGSVDVQYYLKKHLAAGLAYWYEKYDVNDFAQSSTTINSIALPSYLYLGVLATPYTAQTVSARLTYRW